MAWLKIDYKVAKKRYPKEVGEITKKIRAGRSKHRNGDPDRWTWGFSWCVRVEGMINGRDFVKMVVGEKKFPKAKEPETADEEVADYARRAEVRLAAKIGKAEWCNGNGIKFPDEIGRRIRDQFEKDKAEEARINALSPEERQRETDEILRQLSRSPGFVAIGMGPDSMPGGLVAQGPKGPDDILFKPLPKSDIASILTKIDNAIKKR